MKRRMLSTPRPAHPTHGSRPLNCLLTPHRRLTREAAELPHLLRAERAVLRPVWAYLGPVSAEAYRLHTRRCPETHARAAVLDRLATELRRHRRAEALEVLALGVGEGRLDVHLAARLLGAGDRSSSLALVDLSEPLLTAAYTHADETLPLVAVWALLADLEELSTYADLLFLPGRQRVIWLLGGTLGELDDELRFVQYGLAACTAGDLLVLDVSLSAGKSEATRRGRQGDPMRQRLADAQAWLTGALVPYVDGGPLEWTLRLDAGGAVPGSYAWSAVARLPGTLRPREIELWRRKYYQAAPLARCLRALGWEQVAACRYGDALPAELQVFRRCAESGGRAKEAP
ncbi:MAG: hypothetical protein U1A78_16020 [Polyangia bacterium]